MLLLACLTVYCIYSNLRNITFSFEIKWDKITIILTMPTDTGLLMLFSCISLDLFSMIFQIFVLFPRYFVNYLYKIKSGNNFPTKTFMLYSINLQHKTTYAHQIELIFLVKFSFCYGLVVLVILHKNCHVLLLVVAITC